MSDAVADLHPDNDSDTVIVKPAPKRKRKVTETPPTPSGTEKSLRRSGRVVQPLPPVPNIMSDESFQKAKGRKRARKATIAEPESPEMMSSPDSPPPRRLSGGKRASNTKAAEGMDDAFAEMEKFFIGRNEGQVSGERKDKDKTKQQNKGKNKNRAGATAPPDTQKLLAKKDQVIEGKDREISDLEEQLRSAQSLKNASQLALENRDAELETLKLKHKQLVKVANIVTTTWGGMDELANAVNDAEA